MSCALPTLFSHSTRKARKEHECCECHKFIIVGDTYEECKGLWEGRWETYRWCSACDVIRHKVFAVAAPYGIDDLAFGELLETWKEISDDEG